MTKNPLVTKSVISCIPFQIIVIQLQSYIVTVIQLQTLMLVLFDT